VTSFSYSAGQIFWIDDDLDMGQLRANRNTDDAWRIAFGNLDNRVFRQMNLTLCVARTHAEAETEIAQLSETARSGIFVQAVVDLRIPESEGKTPQPKYGIDIAKQLKARNIPFYVLSTAERATRDLDKARIDRTRYFSKDVALTSGSIIPEDLSRLILSEFKNNITWLDLTKTTNQFAATSSVPLDLNQRWATHFPFFGPYRDYVERWELRSGRASLHRVVLRSPSDHSDAFVMQAATVILSGIIVATKPRVVFISSDNPSTFQALQGTDALDSATLQLVIRLLGKDPTSEAAWLEHVLRTCRRTNAKLIIVVPQDERAEEFLSILSKEFDATYDDLPQTKFGDRREREDLIRRCSRLALQQMVLPDASGQARRLHDIYLQNPEILIDPVHWAFLLEAEHTAAEISDPIEVLECFSRATNDIARWPLEQVERLFRGEPVDRQFLLTPAFDTFQRQPDFHSEWTVRAFHDWLTQSWQMPYSVRVSLEFPLENAAVSSWEEHCFRIALDLGRALSKVGLTETNMQIEGRLPSLTQAVAFLSHDTIRRMVAGEPITHHWADLETLRWPHQHYPMPSGLHRKLRSEGRYLWVQTDLLDRAGAVISGREALQRVEARAERHARRIDWLERTCPTLPAGWRHTAEHMLNAIRNRNIESQWSDDATRAQIWQSIHALLHNAAPISIMFYQLNEHAGDGVTGQLLKDLDAKGAGKFLGTIRGKRSRLAPSLIKFIEPQHHSWQSNLLQATEYFDFIRQYLNHGGHNYKASKWLPMANRRADAQLRFSSIIAV
jgi:hypothetical protein